jgi:hypothetical protein
MLSLRRGTVARVELLIEADRGIEHLIVDLGGKERRAYADVAMVGHSQAGDEVVVNTEAVDLSLGSGGNDVVLVNLTRGLEGEADPERHVMKLNYSPLQSGVAPVEPQSLEAPVAKPAAIFQLHGQLAPAVWAAKQANPELRIGYVQTGGGALPGAFSTTVLELRERELLCDHLTAAPTYGGEGEAMSTIGALHAGLTEREWDCAIVGPGPGIIGSGTALGHGGMVALDSAHAALALGCSTIFIARASSGDPRPRHQGISHHTLSVLQLILGTVTIGLSADAPRTSELERHTLIDFEPDVEGYADSGLPAKTMGRDLPNDVLFFEQALAGGMALATGTQGQ